MSRPFVASLQRRASSLLTLTIFLPLLSLHLVARAQPPAAPLFTQAKDRITSFIDDDQRVTLRGNVHPLASSQYDAGTVAPGFSMEHMMLTLLPDAAQQDALNELLDAQHNPESPYYHQWLTPEQYGERFGISDADTAQVVGWLQDYGMEVEEVTAGRRSIVFSGAASQVESTFHTRIHAYKIGNELHHANATEPEIPAALVQVVGGVVSLHDFHSEPMHGSVQKPSPEFTSGGSHYSTAADNPSPSSRALEHQDRRRALPGPGGLCHNLRSGPAVPASQFRTLFGLPANDPQISRQRS